MAEWFAVPLGSAKARVRIPVPMNVTACDWASLPVSADVTAKNEKLNDLNYPQKGFVQFLYMNYTIIPIYQGLLEIHQ